MHYIILDLEFNQRHPENKSEATDKQTLLFEIIQIGAIKLNEKFEAIGAFDAYVKPTVHIDLHPYVENLTNITHDQIHSSKLFIDVFKDFIKFIGEDEVVFVLWGTTDIKELIRNAKYYNIDTSIIPKMYIDIQNFTSKLFKLPKGTKIGLKTATENLEIETKDDFHNAFNDAYYTAEVFKKVYNPKIKAVEYIYQSSPKTRITKPKTSINFALLYYQFEKMYGRDLTQEEKDMIKLAYIMGKTNQFCE